MVKLGIPPLQAAVRVNYLMCALKCPFTDVCCVLCVYQCLTQMVTAVHGPSEPDGRPHAAISSAKDTIQQAWGSKD